VSDWRRIVWLPGTFAVCRLAPGSRVSVPESALLFSVTTTSSETSIVCGEAEAPAGARCETGWSAFRLEGPIPFATTGVLAALSAPLAAAGVGLFAISTYDTDVVLVKTSDARAAARALEASGFFFANELKRGLQ